MKPYLDYQQINPQSELLKKVIKLYYVQRSENELAHERIVYFPNYATTLNIYEHNKLSWTDYSRTHEYDEKPGFLKLLVSKFDRSREIITKGRFNKLTIVFHPLGINHFLPLPLSKYSADHFSFFESFGDSFDKLLTAVFSTEDLEQKRDLLDTYFYQKYLGFKEQRLVTAVQKIFENEGDTSVQELATALGISRKTLLRLFKTHLSYSPSTYKSIVKFRQTLDRYQRKTAKPNFSALAYEADYYDQSDLNFHFKDKTGLTPQQLFSSIQTIEKDLYWKIDPVPKVQDIKS